MTKRRDMVIELVRRIDALEDELRTAKAELDWLLPDDDGTSKLVRRVVQRKLGRRKSADPEPAGFVKKGDTVPGSIADNVTKMVDAEPESTFRTKEFFKFGSPESVRSTLHRMATHGKLRKVDRGEYQSLNGGG